MSDELPPVINFITPADNQNFSVFDTATVRFIVTDETQLTSVTLTLIDANYTPVLPSVNVPIAGKSIDKTVLYLLDNVLLESGIYYFKVSVSDGFNFLSNYRQINLTAAPRKVHAYFVVTNLLNNSYISKIDTDFILTSYANYTGDFKSMDVNSYAQRLYVCGISSGDFYAYNTVSGALQWFLNNPNTQTPYFESIVSEKNNVFISDYNFTIKGYNFNGAQQYLFNVQNNFYPIKLFRHSNYLFAEAKDIASSAKKIIVYDAVNASGVQETSLSMDVIAMHTIDNDNVFVWGNNGNQPEMKIYSISGNGFWSPYTIAAGTIYSVAQVNATTYLIAHSDGIIYRYTYSNNSLLPYINGANATKVIYDDANQQIVSAVGNQLKFYDYSSTNLLQTVTAPDSVLDIGVLYNR